MATNQEGRHAAVRVITGTAGSYNEDFLALFALSGFTTGTFNERFLSWINATLGTSYTSLPAAMQAYAVVQGANNWSSLNTIAAGNIGEEKFWVNGLPLSHLVSSPTAGNQKYWLNGLPVTG